MRDYLGVVPNHLHIPKEFQSKGETELEGEELLMAVARDSMYLLQLASMLRTGLEHTVKRVTQSVMESTVSLDWEQNSDVLSTFTVPANISEIFQ